MLSWFAEEAPRAGRGQVLPGDLLRVVRHRDLDALKRIAVGGCGPQTSARCRSRRT